MIEVFSLLLPPSPLPSPSYSYADFYQQVAPDQKYKDVTNLIEHPPSQQPPGEPIAPPSIPIMLTKKVAYICDNPV